MADGAQNSAKPAPLHGWKFHILYMDATEKAGDRLPVRAEHLAAVAELERKGTLFAAGPFLDAEGLPNGSGMFILRATYAEAEAIAKNDPFVKHGFRTYRIAPWRMSEGSFSLRVNLVAKSFAFD
jgi:uncharacterized protein YciI